MGRRNGPYNADFPTGTRVRIAAKYVLERFIRPDWKYHHPLDEAQLKYAGLDAVVVSAGVYHGGDELYELQDIPGIWHEQCLMAE
jgi:hypothetical protein